ncbi:amidohydrolase [Sphingomonas flavalba]|uniref:amidohydrolase n=1 Tax=Sphingomonas flavalba TaxID=2559804 RepID=UPI00109DCD22|nr:amidohydrolase [Sphingomonas flavalba]
MSDNDPVPTAYVNGRIYTVDAARPWAEAILVRDGRIAAVGSSADISAALGAGGKVVDLGGRMAMPGIHDAHSHLLFSGLKNLYECRLSPDAKATDYAGQLCECVRCMGGKLGDWVIGGDFNQLLSEPGTVDRKFLDEAFPDRPVFLTDWSLHHGLANSRALELAGIDAATEDPFGGRIVRREGSDEPTGELVERATWKVVNVIPQRDPDIYRDALKWALKTASRFGVTSAQEASATRPELEFLKAFDEDGSLPMRVAAHIPWREEHFGMATSEELDRLIAGRHAYSGRNVRTDFVKVFMDGTPLAPHFTDAQLDPETGMPVPGKLLFEREVLAEALKAWDRAGITAKIHCTGDAAVQRVLQAIADARASGACETIQEVSHCCFVNADDLKRFADLNVTAEMSPPVWVGDAPELAAFRERGYPFASLAALGTRITLGTDWIFLPEPNLFPALQGVLQHGKEAVSLERALEMLTLAGAQAVGLGAVAGSIEVGKSADFIVLDRNLFEVPVSAIEHTKVELTVFEGRVVHEA